MLVWVTQRGHMTKEEQLTEAVIARLREAMPRVLRNQRGQGCSIRLNIPPDQRHVSIEFVNTEKVLLNAERP